MILKLLAKAGFKSVAVITFFYLLLYIFIVLKFQSSNLIGDEKRYLEHARGILNFEFTPSDPFMWLMNGPGYPLLLTPFVTLFSDPVLPIRLFNAILLAASLIIFYKAMLFLVEKQIAFLSFLAFGSYFLIWKSLPLVMTEFPSIFFACSIIYYLLKPEKKNKDWLILAFLFAFSAMIKIVFGYIITFSIFFFGAYYFFIQRNSFFLKTTRMLALALLLCTPWLLFTYGKTGRIFFWATSGGVNLYWISDPVPHEYGEYMDTEFTSAIGVPESKIGFEQSHGEEIRRIVNNYSYLEQYDEFKRIALENMKRYPRAYLRNVICNIGRFFFNYPFSYYKQRPSTLINIMINGPLVTFLIIASCILLFQFKKTPPAILVIIIVSYFYMAINFSLSIAIRMMFTLFPLFLAWFTYIANDIWRKYSFFKENAGPENLLE